MILATGLLMLGLAIPIIVLRWDLINNLAESQLDKSQWTEISIAYKTVLLGWVASGAFWAFWGWDLVGIEKLEVESRNQTC